MPNFTREKLQERKQETLRKKQDVQNELPPVRTAGNSNLPDTSYFKKFMAKGERGVANEYGAINVMKNFTMKFSKDNMETRERMMN